MAVNRFDTPVESQYISQYVPIPFQELYSIGKEYNDRVDQSLNDLNTALTEWNNFRSPSAVDTQKWYDLTLRGGEEIADRLASNPDMIKTPEGRLLIQNYINTRPYGQLRDLEQSRDQMIQRQKNIQELIKDGTFNYDWHNLDMTDYNTLKDGIFNKVNVTPFKSTAELVKPYIDGIKDSYLYTKDGYDYYGVLPQTIQNVVGSNIQSLLQSPQSVEYIKQYVRSGLSSEDAQKQYVNDLILSASKYAHANRKANPFSAMEYNRRMQGMNNYVSGEGPMYLTDAIQFTGLRKYGNSRIDLISQDPRYQAAIPLLESEDKKQQAQGKQILEELDKQYQSTQYLFRSILNRHIEEPRVDNGFSNQALKEATNDVLNNFSYPISGNYSELLLNTIPGISQDVQTTPIGKYKTLSNTANLDLVSDAVLKLSGYDNSANPARNKFINQLKTNGFNNAIVFGNERILTIPIVTKDGKQSSYNLQTVRVAISDDEIKQKGLDAANMMAVGASKYTIPANISETSTQSGAYNDGQSEYEKTSLSKTTKPGKDYWVVELVSEIPINDIGAEYLNQSALKQNVNPTTYSGIYSDVQNQAFNLN